MFKRWRDKKKDNEQPESPTKKNQPQSPSETSGFICPVCMISFNSPEDLQIHFETAHVDSEPASTSGDFICPLCMKKFNSPGELQSHFDQVHETQNDQSTIKPTDAHLSQSLPANTTKVWNERHGSLLSFDEELPVPRKESEVSLLSNQLKELEGKTQEIMYLQQELNELNASLKEEKWYSAALKEEVDKMTKEKVELEEKISSLEMEKQTLGKESERKLLDEKENSVKSMAEFAQLKVELAKALEAQTGSQSEQLSLAQRTSQLATENAELLATLEGEKKQQKTNSEEISRLKEQLEDKTRLNENLEKQLLQRPSGDEVITLQNQLSTAQQQVASLRQEKEEEHKSWQEKFNATLTEVNSLQMKVKELEVEKAAKIEQVQSLQTAVTASTENRKQAQEQSQEQQRNLINLQHDLSQVILSVFTFMNDHDRVSPYNVNSMSSLQSRELSIKDLESSLQQKKDDIARFEEERTDLIAKIEAGGGAETVIEQLKQEKVF
ncbi:early endosome antigen 1-like [Stylophora pistillata]|uniref:early endosome antigen 1-like n=1 Tax=Stylophora pistillata TaxID=50429 RepID=UPI000C039A87|nr:early endosome antigen 1-like [Stylophora pistillata]